MSQVAREIPWPAPRLAREEDGALMDADDDDRGILAEIRRGEMGRFDVFVDRHKTRLFRFLYMRSGNRDVAEDLTQDVFVKVMGSGGPEAGTANAGGRVCTWLFAIARNRLADHYRAQQRSKRAYGWLLRLTPRDSTLDPATIAGFEEERARVAGWLAALPEEQREVLSLRVYGDLSLGEIAEITEGPLATVKSRLRYGLGKIGTMLAKETHP